MIADAPNGCRGGRTADFGRFFGDPINKPMAESPYSVCGLVDGDAEILSRPGAWPVLLSFSIQEVIAMGKDVRDPCLAVRLVMESAIPMSKENLDRIDTGS